MTLRRMQTVLMTFVFAASVFFVACEDDDELASAEEKKPVFILQFEHDRDFYSGDNYEPSNYEVTVKFLTDNLAVIPEVTVNDTTFTEFEFGEVYLTLYETVSSEDTLDYSISVGDSVTSGSISLPLVDEATCNGESLLINDEYIAIQEDSAFTLEWDDTPDYVKIEPVTFWYQDWERVITDENQFSVDTSKTWRDADVDDDDEPEFLYAFLYRFRAFNGVRLVSGATPNVYGDYGDGYVTAKVREEFPDVGMHEYVFPKKNTEVNSDNIKTKEQRDKEMKKLKEKFEMLTE